MQPKPLYENDGAKALWDVPLYGESTEVRANRIDTIIVDFEEKKGFAIEMSSPRVENRMKKQENPEVWAIKMGTHERQYPSSQVTQYKHHYKHPRWLLQVRKLDSKEAGGEQKWADPKADAEVHN